MKKKILVWIVFVLAMLFVVPTVFAQGAEPPIELPPITVSSLALNVAALIALALDYFPGLAAWYDARSVADKRKIAVVIAIVIVSTVLGLTCAKVVTSNLVCTTAGVWDVVTNIVLAFITGQGIHAGTKPTPAFKTRILKIQPMKGK